MQRLEVSGAVRPIYGSLGFKRLMYVADSKVIITGDDISLRYYWRVNYFSIMLVNTNQEE